MRKARNVKSSSFNRSIGFLPEEMTAFIKPTRVAHAYARGSMLSNVDSYTALADSIRDEHKGAVPVFHRFRRTVA
jgi:hypothetical protein